MTFNISRSRMSRTPSSSSNYSTSSQKVKLRTIYKNRGSQHQVNLQQQEQSQIRNRNKTMEPTSVDGRLSASLNLDSQPRLYLSQNQSQSISRNTIRRLQTLNCEQELIQKPDPNIEYKQIMHKLDELDKLAEQLIQKKITKIAKRTTSITLKDKGKDQITVQIQNLINKIHNLKSENVQKLNVNQEEMKKFMDRKIRLLQKLMAENSTQSEVLKRYFFAISAINHQNKSMKRHKPKIRTQQQSLEQSKRSAMPRIKYASDRSKTESKQAIFKESANQLAYPAPKLNEYETYRYKARDYTANTQPLPRSSYKCQYLFYSSKTPNAPMKNIDNHTFFGNTKLQPSTYSKDYQKTRADIIDYRQLDSYRNKLRNIQVSYINNNKKEQAQKYINQSRRYIAEQLKMKHNAKIMQKQKDKILQIPKQLNPRQNKHTFLTTQAKSQYKEHEHFSASNIKNRQLNNLKYAYKTLVNN